jgi:hypothetical protein
MTLPVEASSNPEMILNKVVFHKRNVQQKKQNHFPFIKNI